MKKVLRFPYALYLLICSFSANSYLAMRAEKWAIVAAVLPFLFVLLFAGVIRGKTGLRSVRICHHGAVLLSLFVFSVVASAVYHIVLLCLPLEEKLKTLLWSAIVCVIFEAVLFWCGIICVYLTSTQLGVKQRVIGAVCGLIPVVNVIVLFSIIKTVFGEIEVEVEREARNRARKGEELCKTKYPILFVHGVFFRDNKYFNYWGRIPRELVLNGATVYYGNHQSAASVADSAAELAERIKAIVSETGCEKVNIIAHSKGGLDCRYAMEHLDVAQYVASLTTVNTPHRGCQFADFLLTKIPVETKEKIASAYNKALKKLGDENPDFLAAVGDLTAEYCTEFDKNTPAPKGVCCQSVGSLMTRGASGAFPLNFSYHLAKFFDGENDGLVSEGSFSWGSEYTLLDLKLKKGVSHADIIDLSRKNLEGFDVREFYVDLVGDLKSKGY